jgi:hypothetical protein
MRKVLWRRGRMVILFLLVPFSGLWAQSVADDIQQLLYDAEKLAQLKQILTQMYQEYTLLHTDYEQIKGLSQGTFSLHQAYLDGLLLVSPAVLGYSKVGNVLTNETKLVTGYQELDGYSGNYNVFLQRGQRDVDELTLVTTDGDLRMSDAERLSAIDRIDADMTKQLNLMHSFNNSVAIMAAQRAQEAGDIGTVRNLYGIGP